MRRDVVQEFLPRQAARAEAMLLLEVLDEAWAERRRQPAGSVERACSETVLRDVIERLRRLPRVMGRGTRVGRAL